VYILSFKKFLCCLLLPLYGEITIIFKAPITRVDAKYKKTNKKQINKNAIVKE